MPQKILGHSSVTVTEKAYLDLDDEDLRQNYIPYSPLEHIKKSRRKQVYKQKITHFFRESLLTLLNKWVISLIKE